MANYVQIHIINLTPEIKISLGEILNSDKYYFRYSDEDNNFFNTNESTARKVLCELSGLHPLNEITAESRYESYHYDGLFTEFYKNGKWIRGEVRLDYCFEWPAEIDAKVKEYIEEEFTNHFHKFDKIKTEPYVMIDTNEDITISHIIVLRKEEYKDITNKEIWYPIKYEALKQGTQVYVSVGFDMDNLYEFENVDNTENAEDTEDTEDTNSEEFVPINDDDDIPF